MNLRWDRCIRHLLILVSLIVICVGMKNSVEAIEHEKNVISGLRFVDEVDGKELSFAAWEASRDGMYYVALPSAYAYRDFEMEVSYNDKIYSIYIDGEKFRNGDIWKEELREEVHQIRIVDFLGRVHMEKALQVLVSRDVASVMVTVEAAEELVSKEEYANKQYVEKGDIVVLDEMGNVVLEDAMERFRVRGNLTATFEKKPFTFTLSEAKSLCGMTESQNWHLLANATDGSHIRNKIMLDWAEEVSETYQPGGEWVDLFVNGEYQGLYFLTETVEVSENRLNINPSNSALVEMELYYRALQEENCIITDRYHYWVAHNKDVLDGQTLEDMENYLNDIESALYAKDGISEISGRKLNELLDYDSWTDAWLLKEVSSDHDLGTTSQFGVVQNWEKRSILVAGPEWDFDGTLGNGMVPWARNPRNLVTAIPNTKGIESVSQNKWLSQMYQHEDFKEMLIQKFEEEVQPKISRLLKTEIDSYAKKIHRPALLDSLRWNGNGVCRSFALPEGYSLGSESDYHKYDVLYQHVEMIKEFLIEKERFLQELWLEGAEFEVVIEEHNEEGMSLDLNNDIYTWIRKENSE